MTVRSAAVRDVLRANGGWMTDREVCAALDPPDGRPVRAHEVHSRLMAMAESGIVEADRPPDAPNRYRLLREAACGGDPEGPCRPHSEYVAAFPEGWFTAGDLARELGASRQAVRRHARKAVADGILERRERGREAEYRRRRGACPSLRGGGKKRDPEGGAWKGHEGHARSISLSSRGVYSGQYFLQASFDFPYGGVQIAIFRHIYPSYGAYCTKYRQIRIK